MEDMPPEIRPGTLHVSKSSRSVVLGVGVWAAKNRSNTIHIHLVGGEKFHTTITNNPNSERYHRTLFRNLRRTLIESGSWPYGEEGQETEKPDGLEEEENG